MKNPLWTILAYVPFFLGIGYALAAGTLEVPLTIDPPPPFEAERALKEVRALLGDAAPRAPGTPSHDRARGVILDRLTALDAVQVVTEEFDWGETRYRNLLGILPGEQEERIYLSAHYDSTLSTPGAVDNASGVGVLLELARVLSQRKWKRTIVLAFWDGEEDGLLGSRHHVRGLSPKEREAVIAALSLEMVGWRDGRPVIHTFRTAWQVEAPRAVPAWLPHALLGAAREAGEPLSVGDPWIPIHYQIGVRNLRVPFASDDGPFLEVGIPAVFLSNSSFLSFYPQYHRSGDTLDQVGVEALRQAGRTTATAVQMIDALNGRPDPGQEGYLIVGGILLYQHSLLVLSICALLPVLTRFKGRKAGDPVIATGMLLLGGTAVVHPGDPILPVSMIPVLLAFPLLTFRSEWLLKGVALVGVLPALSVIFFLLLVRLRYGAQAPLHVSPHEWTALALGPGLLLIRALSMERAMRKVRKSEAPRRPRRSQ